MSLIILLNNFLHDFSAAGWIFCSVLLWSILRYKIPQGEANNIIMSILKTVMLLMRLSLGGIVFFGIIRALAYKQYEWSIAAGTGQVVLLVVKHVILLFVFILGLVYYFRTKKIVRENLHE